MGSEEREIRALSATNERGISEAAESRECRAKRKLWIY